MATSGIEVSDEAMEAFNQIKGKKGSKIRVFVCDAKKGKVVIHEKDTAECQEANVGVIKSLLNEIGAEPVYLVIDFPVGSSVKLICVKWAPDESSAISKMICSATFDEVKSKFHGCHKYLQFTETDDFDDLDLSKY